MDWLGFLVHHLLLIWISPAYSKVGESRPLVVLVSGFGGLCLQRFIGQFGKRNNWVFKDQAEPAWQVYRRTKDLILFWARGCKGYEGLPNGALVRNWDITIGVHVYWEDPSFVAFLGSGPSFFFFCSGISYTLSLFLFLALVIKKKKTPIKYSPPLSNRKTRTLASNWVETS